MTVSTGDSTNGSSGSLTLAYQLAAEESVKRCNIITSRVWQDFFHPPHQPTPSSAVPTDTMVLAKSWKNIAPFVLPLPVPCVYCDQHFLAPDQAEQLLLVLEVILGLVAVGVSGSYHTPMQWLRTVQATAAGAANRLADRLESAGLKPEPKAPPPPPPPAARGGWKGVVVPTALSKRFAFAR